MKFWQIFQKAADRILALDLPPAIKTTFEELSRILPKAVTKAFYASLKDILKKEKDKKIQEKSIKDLLIMIKGAIKF